MESTETLNIGARNYEDSAQVQTELKDLNTEINVLRKDNCICGTAIPHCMQNLEDISKTERKLLI